MKKKKNPLLKILMFCLPQLLYSSIGKSNDYSIISIKKNITLSDDEPVFHDLIINAGENFGLKKGQLYVAFRRVGIKDDSGVQSFGEIDIPIGEVKILSVFSRVAIARQVKLYPREENPIVDIFGLMGGDHVELKK